LELFHVDCLHKYFKDGLVFVVAECVDVDSPAQLPCHASALRALILMSATTASFEFETPVGRFQAARRSDKS
jgi:hypothetical protein